MPRHLWSIGPRYATISARIAIAETRILEELRFHASSVHITFPPCHLSHHPHSLPARLRRFCKQPTSTISSSSAPGPSASQWYPYSPCLNLDLSNPPSLNYSTQPLARIAFDLRYISCVAPGCAIVQTYNISGSGIDDIYLNVTDSEDVKKRCEAAGGEPEWRRNSYSVDGKREIQHYCVVRDPDEVQGVISNMTGAERANIWCSTQEYTRQSAANRKGLGTMALGAVLLGSIATALLTSI